MSERFIKLIRDRVGDENDVLVYQRAIVGDNDFHWMLAQKLVEEAREYEACISEPRDLGAAWDELIDVFEVVSSLVQMHEGLTMKALMRDAETVRNMRGGFMKRMSLWVRRPQT